MFTMWVFEEKYDLDFSLRFFKIRCSFRFFKIRCSLNPLGFWCDYLGYFVRFNDFVCSSGFVHLMLLVSQCPFFESQICRTVKIGHQNMLGTCVRCSLDHITCSHDPALRSMHAYYHHPFKQCICFRL
jgi:hypothetical protein